MRIATVIPTIPTEDRERMLARAVRSVKSQQRPTDQLVIQIDVDAEGAAATRNRALAEVVDCDFVAFLDDDDEWMPQHLARLQQVQQDTAADLVYPWYAGINQNLFDPDPYGQPFDAFAESYIRNVGNFIPVTCLVRTSLLRQVGGFTPMLGANPAHPCEDWATWLKLLDAGAKFVHCPERTWVWWGHGEHTSGRPWTMRGFGNSAATRIGLESS